MRLAVLSVYLLAIVAFAPAARAQQFPQLDPITRAPDAHSFRATGFDPEAPRPLVLWRHSGGQTFRVNTATSKTDGRFDFGEISIPIAEGSFHVAEAGKDPALSRPFRTLPAIPSPRVVRAGTTRRQVSVQPAIFEGTIELRDDETGRLWARREIITNGDSSLRFDLSAIPLPAHVRMIRVKHRLGDGRESEAAFWRLDED